MNVQILALCNEQRQNNGLEKLMTREDLWEQVAQVRAGEIVNYFSHTRPNGSSCFSLYDEAGLDYRAAGENIAAGYYGASAVVDGWMNSTGHRANILSKSFICLIPKKLPHLPLQHLKNLHRGSLEF